MAWQGYKVVSKLGEGGMATVYKAMQESLQRPVAIKILAADLKSHPEILERFEKESLIIAQLNHPHIIHVIDKGVTGKGRPYFVMEYVEGMSLEEAINRGKLDYPKKMDVLVQMCKALAYAHKNGVIHRDIKPANIIIDGDAQVRILDFGIAHFYDSGPSDLHTGAEDIMGTSAYMAPEQHESAEAASVQSDLYSLGIVMYEIFTGVRPQGEIPPPTQFEPDLDRSLNDLILRCVETDPSGRPASADEIKNALLHIFQGGHLSKEQKDRAKSDIEGIESQFSLLDVLKEDKHGSVYLYEDAVKQKLIVLKTLPLNASGLKEHKLLSRLQHPNIAAVLGVSRNESGLNLVTEYLTGGSLAEQLLAPIRGLKVIDWGVQVAEALAFAHRNRVIHGSLRPSNILFDENGQVKLTDFGIKDEDDGDEPNWYKHDKLDGIAGDLYSLGAVGYRAVTGQVPTFRGGKLVRGKKFAELSNRTQEVVTRLLEAKEGKRYPNADVVLADLKGIQKNMYKRSEEKKKDEIKRNIAQVAKKVKRQERQIPWGRWIKLVLLIAIVAEEVVWGYGYKWLLPQIEPYWNELSGSEVWIEWTDKAKEIAKEQDVVDW